MYIIWYCSWKSCFISLWVIRLLSHVYTRLQKRWHATSVYNERWDSAKSYPNFPGRKRFIMRKDFPWIMREVNHWLCICANISHKGDGSCRSWIKLIRCQRFCNRVYSYIILHVLCLNILVEKLKTQKTKCSLKQISWTHDWQFLDSPRNDWKEIEINERKKILKKLKMEWCENRVDMESGRNG